MNSVTVIDQMNRRVIIPNHPKRIVSLVPSQTELLFDLGLSERVVGITKFCIHPEAWYAFDSAEAKQRVGGTKNINFEILESLQPDLIIGNKEENSQEDILQLEQKYSVWMSDIYTLEDALDMIQKIGTLTQTSAQAEHITQQIRTNSLQIEIKDLRFSCIYLIWNNPIMTVGKNTFIDNMIAKTGLTNLITAERYPIISVEDLMQLQPDVLLLSSEPFPFNESHIHYFQKIMPNTLIKIVDGELFSWYGSRLLHSFDYISKLNFT